MSTLFMPCTVDGYAPTSASYRFRCLWPAKYWDGADVYPAMTRPWLKYDTYVFQKAYLTKKAQEALGYLSSRSNVVLAFDLCDADWLLSPEHEKRLLAWLPLFDFAVAPTEPIRAWLAKWLPAYVIPDRLDMEEFENVQVKPALGALPTVVWFGYAHNIHAIEHMWPTIEENGLTLTILSNELPEMWASRPHVQFVEWQQDTANQVIAMHEVALCPPVSIYKSDNRELTARALYVTPVKTIDQLESVATMDIRRREALRQALHGTLDGADVRQSVVEWQDLIQKYYDHKQKGKA